MKTFEQIIEESTVTDITNGLKDLGFDVTQKPNNEGWVVVVDLKTATEFIKKGYAHTKYTFVAPHQLERFYQTIDKAAVNKEKKRSAKTK